MKRGRPLLIAVGFFTQRNAKQDAASSSHILLYGCTRMHCCVTALDFFLDAVPGVASRKKCSTIQDKLRKLQLRADDGDGAQRALRTRAPRNKLLQFELRRGRGRGRSAGPSLSENCWIEAPLHKSAALKGFLPQHLRIIRSGQHS